MGVRQVVEPVLLQPPRMGLLASALTPSDSDERWVNGIEWTPEICDADSGAFDLCADPDWDTGESNVGTTGEYEPVGIYRTVRCSTLGSSQEELRARAERALLTSESALIAKELWAGAVATASGFPNDFLAKSPTVLETGTAQDPIKALSELEHYGTLNTLGAGRVLIHVAKPLATYWYSLGLLRREGNLLLTALDSVVVADAGYPGSGPADQAATFLTSWAYVTGDVQIRRGPIEVLGPAGPQISHDNIFEIIAWRPIAATFDPCDHYVINVTHTNTTEG